MWARRSPGRCQRACVSALECQLGRPPAAEVYARLRASVIESFQRAREVDLYLLHNLITPEGWLTPGATEAEVAGTPRAGTPVALFAEAVRPAFERLVSEGLTRAWRITGIGVPAQVIAVVAPESTPAAVQCITNLLNSAGGSSATRATCSLGKSAPRRPPPEQRAGTGQGARDLG